MSLFFASLDVGKNSRFSPFYGTLGKQNDPQDQEEVWTTVTHQYKFAIDYTTELTVKKLNLQYAHCTYLSSNPVNKKNAAQRKIDFISYQK